MSLLVLDEEKMTFRYSFFPPQEEKMTDISIKPDTCREASCVSSSASQEKTVPFRRGNDINVPLTDLFYYFKGIVTQQIK